MLGAGKSLEKSDVLVFNSLNGMERSPTITETGIIVAVRLRPELRIGARFRVEAISENVVLNNYQYTGIIPTLGAGEYKIRQVLHLGDNYEEVWTSVIDGFLEPR